MIQFFSVDLNQAQPQLVGIEVSSFFQIPQFQIIGLPSREIQESKDRIRSAIDASGFEFPKRKVIVNLTPAGTLKQGTHLDLAIALAILAAPRPVNSADPFRVLAVGELALNGKLNTSCPVLRALIAALDHPIDLILFPKRQENECRSWVHWLARRRSLRPGLRIGFIGQLSDFRWEDLQVAQSVSDLEPPPAPAVAAREEKNLMLPQASGRLLCEIALAGHHHLLLLGPKGAGKTTQLHWLQALSARTENPHALDHELYLELSRSTTPQNPGMMPFRWVSPRIRPAALSGSFSHRSRGLIPGECQLAHGGILVADEFPEWHRDSRELLREPLESGHLSLQSVEGRVLVKSQFLFAATGNFCECGGWPRDLPVDASFGRIRMTFCRCPEHRKQSYQSRISGPILDRMDLLYRVFPKPVGKLDAHAVQTHLDESRSRVESAKKILISQWGKVSGNLDSATLERVLGENPALLKLLSQLEFSSLRSRHKTLRVAMTLAALSGQPIPSKIHLAQAVHFRSGDSTGDAGFS